MKDIIYGSDHSTPPIDVYSAPKSRVREILSKISKPTPDQYTTIRVTKTTTRLLTSLGATISESQHTELTYEEILHLSIFLLKLTFQPDQILTQFSAMKVNDGTLEEFLWNTMMGVAKGLNQLHLMGWLSRHLSIEWVDTILESIRKESKKQLEEGKK